MNLIKLQGEDYIIFLNIDTVTGYGIKGTQVKISFTDGTSDTYTLETEQAVARLVRELEKYTISTWKVLG